MEAMKPTEKARFPLGSVLLLMLVSMIVLLVAVRVSPIYGSLQPWLADRFR